MKNILKILFISFFIVSLVIIDNIAMAKDDSDLGKYNENLMKEVTKENTSLTDEFGGKIGNIYATIFTILRVLGIAGMVIQGVRYMYASGDSKGKIKQSLIYIIIGTMFIFAAGFVVDFIVNSAGDIIN